ncbi:P27 family phage terminase small subunit, partial [Cronobacter sakazakii]|uniref:P27 family phage terminase small subunit n=1 Tax=Cronobacter sakazakii TaxID=28141 RepID=UPI0021578BFA
MANVRASGGGRKGNLPSNLKSSITRIAPPPELLSDVAVKVWKSQSKTLIERGLFEPEDAPILLAYCNAFHFMIEADKMISEEGFVDVGGTGGFKKNPPRKRRKDCGFPNRPPRFAFGPGPLKPGWLGGGGGGG